MSNKTADMQRRVAITGVAITCGLGHETEAVWRAVRDGACGVNTVGRLDTSTLHCHLAAEVETDPTSPDRAMGFAVRVAQEAVQDAALDLAMVPRYRRGVALGTSVGGLERGETWHAGLLREGPKAARAGLLLTYPLYTSADAIATHLGLAGPKVVLSNACAAGGNAIGWAADQIRLSRADIMIAGGVDVLDLLSLGGFDSLKALDSEPCAPLSRSTGLNLGEGAAFVVLEAEEIADARQATPLAWMRGYGLSSDAHHATAPDPRGDGARRSMSSALRRGSVSADQVDYLNAHGTGTPANDSSEPQAVRALFGAKPPPTSSTKSQVGHTLGAAGAVEAVVTVLAIRDGTLPPTINVDPRWLDRTGLDVVANEGREAEVNTALSNSFAFGGNNCSLLFTSDRGGVQEKPSAGHRRVVVTGSGAISGFGAGRDALVAGLRSGASAMVDSGPVDTGLSRWPWAAQIDPSSYLGLVDRRYLRRVDQIGQLVLAVTRQALSEASLVVPRDKAHRYGMVFGTFTGPLETVAQLSAVIVGKGVHQVSPRLFPNSVVNAAAGHACLSHQLKGPLSTLASGGTAGLGAIEYAADLIADGEADVMLAVAADELTSELHLGYDQLGLLASSPGLPYSRESTGLVPGAGAGALVLEEYEHALARGAPILAEVTGSANTSDTVGVARVDPDGAAIAESFRLAMDRAQVDATDLLACFGDARGTEVLDRAEARALTKSLGAETPLANLSGQVGHMGASTPMLSAVAALETLESGWLPHASGLDTPIAEAQPLAGRRQTNPDGSAVLVSALNWGGSYSSIVLVRGT